MLRLVDFTTIFYPSATPPFFRIDFAFFAASTKVIRRFTKVQTISFFVRVVEVAAYVAALYIVWNLPILTSQPPNNSPRLIGG